MANIQQWNPFEEMLRMRGELNRFFGLSPFSEANAPATTSRWGPSVDLKETETAFHVSAEIPGVNPDDLDVTVSEDSLTLRGEIKHEASQNEGGYRQIERRYGTFQRTIPFPVSVQHDQATADYKNGILEITVPKAEHSATQSVRLKINQANQDPKQLQ